MPKHRIIFLTILFLFVFTAWISGDEQGVSADEVKTEAILLRIKQASSNIESLEGDFVQKKKLEILKDMPDSYGKLYYMSPGRLRWEITAPVIMGFIINGEHGKKWRGKDGRSMKFDLSREPLISAISNQVFSWARGDYERLKAGYDISILSEEPVEIRLRPISPVEQKYIESIDLAFSEEESHVTKIEINDKKGGSTQISFSNMKINPGLSEEIF